MPSMLESDTPGPPRPATEELKMENDWAEKAAREIFQIGGTPSNALHEMSFRPDKMLAEAVEIIKRHAPQPSERLKP